MAMKILLIEDDLQICKVITKYFTNNGAEIAEVHNGTDALDTVEQGMDGYSLVLLDIMLPGADGFTVCRSIRRRSDIPVIFITARAREEDILHGYDLGCDDYIVKPFLLTALFAKCTAVVNRNEGIKNSVVKCGDISIDTRKLTCYVGDEEVDLTQKEFALMSYLINHEGWVVDRNTLLDRVWGEDYFGVDRVVDNTVKRLRKKLGEAGKQIHTAIGRGYKLTDN